MIGARPSRNECANMQAATSNIMYSRCTSERPAQAESPLGSRRENHKNKTKAQQNVQLGDATCAVSVLRSPLVRNDAEGSQL